MTIRIDSQDNRVPVPSKNGLLAIETRSSRSKIDFKAGAFADDVSVRCRSNDKSV